MFTLLTNLLAWFGLGALLMIAYVVTTDRMRSVLQVGVDAFLAERFGYVYLSGKAMDVIRDHPILGICICVLASPILAPLGFLELGLRYALKRLHKSTAPSAPA